MSKENLLEKADAIEFLSQVLQGFKAALGPTLREYKYASSIADAMGLGLRHFNFAMINLNYDPERLFDELLVQKSFNHSLFAFLTKEWQLKTPVPSIHATSPTNHTTQSTTGELPLNESDIQHWHEHGYVIVKEVISKNQAAEVSQWLFECNGMSANIKESWYKGFGSIMQEIYQHPLLEHARKSKKARLAYEQLWGVTNLICSVDKVSINPPEFGGHYFQGPHLHLDVNFKHPSHFHTQGIVYLNDVAENQGALTVVPGFHHQFSNWLANFNGTQGPQEFNFKHMKTKSIAAEAGDLIIWHHWLPHGASPNRAKFPRLAQYMTMYAPEPMLIK